MKLVIPPEVQIGGRNVRIRISEKALTIADLAGLYSDQESIIRLSLLFEGNLRNSTQVFEALLHELIHAIDGLYMRELEERQTNALGSGLAQVLQSLGIEPDFSQIPEETV